MSIQWSRDYGHRRSDLRGMGTLATILGVTALAIIFWYGSKM